MASIYYFNRDTVMRIPILMRDDDGLHLYAGNKRLGPGPWPVLWFPGNWIAFAFFLVIFPFRRLASKRRASKKQKDKTKYDRAKERQKERDNENRG